MLYPFIGQLNESEIQMAHFEQDGAAAHTAHSSIKLLEEVFKDLSEGTGLHIHPTKCHPFILASSQICSLCRQSKNNSQIENRYCRLCAINFP
jgi:hypothetical protein